jgi:opacity protein-like surface antigen
MKHIVLLAAAVVVFTGVCSAQLKGGAGIHGGISISAFEEAIKDYYGLGYGFGAHGDLNINKYFGVRLNFDYHMFGLDSKKLIDQLAASNGVAASDLTLEGWTAKIMGITLNGIGKLPTGGPITPYALAGLGINVLSQSDPKLTYQGQDVTNQVFGSPESKTKFGINFGAGADFAASKTVNVGLDFRYVLIFSKDDATQAKNNAHMPITVYVTYLFN